MALLEIYLSLKKKFDQLRSVAVVSVVQVQPGARAFLGLLFGLFGLSSARN